MTRREKFFKIIKREMEGYIPFEFNLCPSLYEKFKEKTGEDDYREYYDMPYRFISAPAKQRDVDFRRYFDEDLGDGVSFNEWGAGEKKGSFEHFSRKIYTMGRFTTIEEFENYPYPDPVNGYDWSSLESTVKSIKEKDCIAVAGMAMTIFEIAWYLRGMEEFMMDLITEPELACCLMDKITSIRCKCARRYAASGVDVLHLGDDVATQIDMMMSPDVWRRYIKPRLKAVIDAAREVRQDIIIDYHSDGNVQKIVPDLIEIGVDILNPVQPECMDPVRMKELYGDRLSFRGAIGTQSTMPFGAPEEVDRVCKEMIEKVGKCGGFILAPTHTLEPEVPWENIEAMINAIKKYSKA